MNVQDLIEVLSEFDPELEVIYEIYSDYSVLEKSDITVVEAVAKGGYVERFHAYQYKESIPNVKKYLCFPGN